MLPKKQKGPEVSPAPRVRRLSYILPVKFQAQLHCAGAARAKLWVGAVGVRCKAGEPEWWPAGWIANSAAGATARVRELRVVEDIEEFSFELGLEAFLECEKLCDRQIPVSESRVAEDVILHVAVGAIRWRKHHRTSYAIATEIGQGCERQLQLLAAEVRIVRSRAIRQDRVGWVIAGIGNTADSTIGIGKAVNWREIAGFAEEVPLLTVRATLGPDFVSSAEVIGHIRPAPGQAALKDGDGVEPPPFEKLPEALLSGNGVIDRQREPMPDVEIG